LPVLGGAIGSYVGGPAGSRIGGQLAANAGGLFGLELEGLSEEDQEFEVARRLVRFSDAAAKNLLSAPSSASPQQAANAAAIAAAKRHAPGMIRAAGPSAAVTSKGCPNCGKAGNGRDGQGCPNCGDARSGRWIRRGPHIIIVNAHGSGRSRNKSSE
jgi:RNA polymerase subunit RPABC4/transcription elongation factor Spt4